jgi:hypothetical protein
MKKLAALLLIIVVIAGCNKEKIYKENLEGIWRVYKYLYRNTDKTQQFQNQYPNYTITFTSGGAYTEFFTNPDSTYIMGTYSFADNEEKLVLTNTFYTYVTDSIGDTIATVPHEINREYTIRNLMRDHVELLTDTSHLYLRKDL